MIALLASIAAGKPLINDTDEALIKFVTKEIEFVKKFHKTLHDITKAWLQYLESESDSMKTLLHALPLEDDNKRLVTSKAFHGNLEKQIKITGETLSDLQANPKTIGNVLKTYAVESMKNVVETQKQIINDGIGNGQTNPLREAESNFVELILSVMKLNLGMFKNTVESDPTEASRVLFDDTLLDNVGKGKF